MVDDQEYSRSSIFQYTHPKSSCLQVECAISLSHRAPPAGVDFVLKDSMTARRMDGQTLNPNIDIGPVARTITT